MNAKKPVLTLKQFMLRQQVLGLYRKIMRDIRKVPGPEHQHELRHWARTDFRSNAHHTDETTIRMMIKYGERCQRELRTSLDLAKS